MKKILVYVSVIAVCFALWGCGGASVAATEPPVIETEPVPTETEAIEIVETTELVVEETPAPTESSFKEYEYFSCDVSYDFEYIANGEVIPHVFIEPSTAQDYEKIPLVVWLHGSGEKNRDAVELEWSGLSKAMIAWDFMHLEGMNAYIVAPHLVQGDFWTPYWCSEESAQYITDLIDYYVKYYNVDPNQVVLSGHSLGGQGVAYLTQVLPDTFCAAAPLSVYHPCIKLTNKDVPVWCFQGNPSHGEDSTSHNYAYGDFANFYGQDVITMLNVGHGGLPMAVFSMDTDGNQRTDLFEWFAQCMQENASKALKEELQNNLLAETPTT